MSNFELDKAQMEGVGSDLTRMFVNVGITTAQLKGSQWLLNDNSPTSQAIRNRLGGLTQKMAREAVNVGYLSAYNQKVIRETGDAELRAYMDMMNYDEAIKDLLSKAVGIIGITSKNVKGVKDLIDKVKKAYKNANDKIVDKTTIKGNWKAHATYKQGDYKYEKGLVKANGSYKLGDADAHASYEGGLFKTDKNGNLVLDPRFKAAAGASATLFTAAGAASIGNDMLGAGVDGDITVGKVSAEVGVSTGLYDKDGNLSPNAHLNASAEAILLDASADAHATVLGVDAKAKASINIGAGAHAKVDIGDGKISADIGASLGIGFSLKFEIDYSKALGFLKGSSTGFSKTIGGGSSKSVGRAFSKWF